MVVGPKSPARGLIFDAMLGHLARRLRLLGFDAEYHSGSDEDLIRKAYLENRILVTMDTGIKKSRLARNTNIIFVENTLTDHRKQMAYLLKTLRAKGMNPDLRAARCSLCNAPLLKVTRKSVQNRIPAYTYLKVKGSFSVCPKCRRTYWQGSHYQRFFVELQEVMKGSKHEVSDKQVQKRKGAAKKQ